MSVGEIIKTNRMNYKDTQVGLAEKIGVSRQTIINWESGRTVPDSDSLLKVAELYHLSLDELCGLPSQEQMAIRELHLMNLKRFRNLLLLLLLGSLVSVSSGLVILLALVGVIVNYFLTDSYQIFFGGMSYGKHKSKPSGNALIP